MPRPTPTPTPPNPYRECSLRKLTDAIRERAIALQGDAPVGRRDTRYLLCAALERLDPLTAHLTSPYNVAVAGGPVASCYFEHYLKEAVHLRYVTLVHAADAIGLDYDQRKLISSTAWRAAAELAVRDEAGLLEGLRMLDDIRIKKDARGQRANERTGHDPKRAIPST